MNTEDLLLVSDIFKIYIGPESRTVLHKAGYNVDNFTSLPPSAIDNLPLESFKFSERPQLLESILTARLSLPQTPIFEYLCQTYINAAQEANSSLFSDQSLRKLAIEAQELALNYLGLALGTPEMFENANFDIHSKLFRRTSPSDSASIKRTRRFIQLLFKLNDGRASAALFDAVGDQNEFFSAAMVLFRQEFLAVTVYNPEAVDLIEAFMQILQFPVVKINISQLITEKFAKGAEYETNHILGFLFALGPVAKHNDPNYKSFHEGVHMKIKACKTKNGYLKQCSNLHEVYRKYKESLMKVVRALMRNEHGLTNCADRVIEFFRNVIEGNSLRASLGFSFNVETQKKQVSDAFAILFCDVLIELALPVATRPELLEKVDFDSVDLLAQELPSCKLTFFGVDPGPRPQNPLGSASKFYFFAFEAVDKMFNPCAKKAEQLYRHITKIKQEKQKYQKGSFQYNLLKNQSMRLKTDFSCYRVVFEDNERINRFFAIYGSLFEKLLTRDIWVPEEFILSYADSQSFLANIVQSYFQVFKVNHLPLYTKFLMKLVRPEYEQSLVHVKVKFSELLFTFNIMEHGSLVTVLRDVIGPDNMDQFIKNILAFYALVERGSGQEMNHMKFQYRHFVTKFLVKAFDYDEYKHAFIHLKDTPQMTHFFGFLLTDMNFFLDAVFKNLETLANPNANRELGEQDPSNVNPTNTTELTELTKTYLKSSRNNLRLFDKISELIPTVCTSEAWAKKVAIILNFYASKLSSKNYIKFKFSGINEIGLKPLEFIKQLVLIYARLSDEPRFQEEIINDERSYSREVLIDIGNTAWNRQLAPPEILQRYENLIRACDSKKIEKDNWNKIVENPPDEYLCQITADLMIDPVQLPTSKSIVEKKAILEHLALNGNYDPFNRMKLSETEIIPLLDLKAKIDQWIEERKRKFIDLSRQPDVKLQKNGDQSVELYGEDIKEEKKPDDDFMKSFKSLN